MSHLSRYFRSFCLFAAVLVLASCTAPAPPTDTTRAPTAPVAPPVEPKGEEAPRQRINIGLLLPLSGPQGHMGQALLQAAMLALYDSEDQRLHLIPADSLGQPDGAAAAFELLRSKNVDLIIGPLFAANTQRITPLAQAAGIPILSLSSDHKVAAPGVYLMGFRPEEQVQRILRYSASRGYQSYGVLLPETPYGDRLLSTIGQEIVQLERTLAAIEFYPPDTDRLFEPVKHLADYDHRRSEYLAEIEFIESLGKDDDFGAEFRKDIENKETIGDLDYDAVLLPEGGALLRTLAPMLSYYDVDTDKIKLLGTGLWDDPLLTKEPQLIGGWFAGPKRDRFEKFRKRYEDIFGQPAPRVSTLAYDAVALAAILTRTSPIPDYSAAILTDPNGFEGLDGPFRLYPDGLNERALAVYEITQRGFNIISPAPNNFIPVQPAPKPLNRQTLDYKDPWDAARNLSLTPAADPAADLEPTVPLPSMSANR